MSLAYAAEEPPRTRACDWSGKRWFVVKCQPRRELFADKHLQRQNFETFLPLSSSVPTGAARPTAFFPSYLFVHLNPAIDRWRSVNGTYGVSHILHVGGQPTPAPAGLVEHLIELTNDLGELGFDDVLETGRPVRVIGGPFDRRLGTFDGLDGEGRVRVLLDMMGRPVSVSLFKGSVMAV